MEDQEVEVGGFNQIELIWAGICGIALVLLILSRQESVSEAFKTGAAIAVVVGVLGGSTLMGLRSRARRRADAERDAQPEDYDADVEALDPDLAYTEDIVYEPDDEDATPGGFGSYSVTKVKRARTLAGIWNEAPADWRPLAYLMRDRKISVRNGQSILYICKTTDLDELLRAVMAARKFGYDVNDPKQRKAFSDFMLRK